MYEQQLKREVNMKLKRHITALILVLVLILLALALFLYNYNFPKRIDVERRAVIFTLNNNSSAQDTLIKVNGTLYKPLFRQQKFIGSFRIDGYEFTQDQEFTLYIVDRKKDINMSALFYLEDSASHNIKNNSLIWFDDNFENINIWPSKEWIEQDSVYITTGDSYEQAIEVQDMMRNKFGEMFAPP